MATTSQHESRELPREVASSIQRILELQPQSDPLDALRDFSPVDALNQLFPDEASLSQVASVQTRLHQQELQLQDEISALMEELRSAQSPARMQLIQEMIADLLSQMNRIREKATESEAIVRNITKDIQSLDLAKKNLIQSMTALKRFQMLVNALSQLEELVAVKKYSEISQTLAAVKEISAFFKNYRAIEQVATVWRRIQEQQGILRSSLEEDFDKFLFQDPAKPMRPSTILDVCTVADVMGEDVKHHLIDKYCSSELREYRRIFRVSDEAGQLDNVSRRFAWFRRILKMHDEEHSRAFPPSWRVGQYLCAKFIEVTREDLIAVLSKASKSLTVSLLLESLQATLEFEAQISQKFNAKLSDILKCTTGTVGLYKPASSSFEPHMGVYIDAQDKALADMLAPHRSTKSRQSLDEVVGASDSLPVVLPSSTELFYFYAQNLEQCSKLTTGKPLFELCALYKKWLRLYGEDVLLAGLKRLEPSRKSLDSQKFSKSDVLNACLLINTAEYCQVTGLELEEKIKEKVNEGFKEEVTFQSERDYFLSVISTAILSLLRELENACERSFSSMSRTTWGAIDNVSGQSPYVGDLADEITAVADLVRDSIQQKKFARNFFDKTVNLILARFSNAMVKGRPLKDRGAEQLLIDLQAIKACLLRIPGGSQTLEEAQSSLFGKSVTKSTSRIETLLKVVSAPSDPADVFINNYCILIGDSSFSNFQKILDLKGLSRSEQNGLSDTFLTMTSTMPDLESTSFLSSLDMDPTTSQLTSVTSPTGGRMSLPGLLGGGAGEGSVASLFGALGTPPLSRSATPGPAKGDDGVAKKTGFADLRKFVTFGMRRDSVQ